ncbi:cyclodehydratase [Mycolicibacterium sp.]|uniref:cyclodehydratase n=1 Tax=Mycolicibacterium sp. TaxID=2320850 RepID=UPI001A298644|nr:cyclodehydratase [Mycolicibacterium sp.]MBJ7401737.1 cyclodehydratase [Mycolicibacterium sp.]
MTFALDPALPVLLRPDGVVQVGWDPRRAVLVRPPAGLSASALAMVLRAMSAPLRLGDLHRLAGAHGLGDEAGFDELLYALVAAGVVREHHRARGGRALSIRVHGAGPLSELLAEGLRCSGARVGVSSHGNAAGAPAGVDLVVLADSLASDPRLLRDLHVARVPHLPVRVRDGTGMVGPLVIPGVTSCLGCADLHRTDRDAAWPALAIQLREVIAHADHPTVLATAALALAQLQHIIGAVRGTDPPGAPPATFNATIEVNVAAHTIRARRWSRHPLCGCWHPRTALAARQA